MKTYRVWVTVAVEFYDKETGDSYNTPKHAEFCSFDAIDEAEQFAAKFYDISKHKRRRQKL